MTGYIAGVDGLERRLPPLLSWSVRHGLGESADAFELCCLYSPHMAEPLRMACRFRAEHQGETVFTGVVDEYEATASEKGMTLSLSGRSLAALLMDNEAEAAEYWGAGLDFIISKHVTPWGVTNIRKKPMETAGRLTVESGKSQWSVLRDFCIFCGGVTPRFDRFGTLLLDGSGGGLVRLGVLSPMVLSSFRDRRYGVISQALVKNKAAGSRSIVENAEFTARGGSCRRVVNVPRYTGADAMRHTGSWQLRRSAEGAEALYLTIAEPFAAFAGDSVRLDWSPLGRTGSYLCRESLTTAGPEGGETRLTLTEVKD